MKPFQNEHEVVNVGDLAFENRVDRISVHGAVDIWRDKDGLAKVRSLKRVVDALLQELEGSDLPARIPRSEVKDMRDNPFETGDK